MTSVAHETRAHHLRTGRVVITRPTGMGMVGFLTLLTGAWGGIVAFVGPVWGYNANGTQSWAWNANHWLLHLIPGAVAVVAGLLMMSQAPARRATARSPFFISGLLAAGAGAWFILGPVVFPMVYSGPVYGPANGHVAAFLNALGANLGPGILLCIFGGMALKSMIREREVPLAEPVGAAPVAAAPVAPAAAAPVAPAAAAAAPAAPVADPAGHTHPMAGAAPVAPAAPQPRVEERAEPRSVAAPGAVPVEGRAEPGVVPVEGRADPGAVPVEGRADPTTAVPPAVAPETAVEERRRSET